MIYLSCTTAKTCQKFGYITPDFNNLIAGISHLIVSAMQNKLETHVRYFNNLTKSMRRKEATCFKFGALLTQFTCIFNQLVSKKVGLSKQIKREYRHRCFDCVYEKSNPLTLVVHTRLYTFPSAGVISNRFVRQGVLIFCYRRDCMRTVKGLNPGVIHKYQIEDDRPVERSPGTRLLLTVTDVAVVIFRVSRQLMVF